VEVGSFAYNLVLLLHIICVIVGFGGVILNGIYAARAQQLPPEQNLAVMEVNSFVSMKVAEVFIYLVPIFGLGLVSMSGGAYAWGDLWIWLSIVVYVLSLGVSHGLLMPTVKRMLALQREMVAAGPPTGGPPPQVAQLQAMGKRVGGTSMLLNLSLGFILVLMIWKPT
jgi:uncharacterized membrane protein